MPFFVSSVQPPEKAERMNFNVERQNFISPKPCMPSYFANPEFYILNSMRLVFE